MHNMFGFTSDWPQFLFRWLLGWGGPCHPRCSPWSPWTPRPPTWWATGVSVANTGQVSLSEFASLPSLVHSLPGNAAPQSPGLEWDTSTIEWPSNDPLRGVLTWNIITVFEKLNFNNLQLLLTVFFVQPQGCCDAEILLNWIYRRGQIKWDIYFNGA